MKRLVWNTNKQYYFFVRQIAWRQHSESYEEIHVGLGRQFGTAVEKLFDDLPNLLEACRIVNPHVKGVPESETGRKVLAKSFKATDGLLRFEMPFQQHQQI